MGPMVVYAEYELPADGFRIGRAFAKLPGVEVELERVVPTGDAVIPFIWVRGADPNDVVRITREERAVEHIRVLCREAVGSTQYRVVWNRTFRDAVVAVAEADLTLLSGTGTADVWRFEFRAPDKRPLAAFREHLRANDIPMSLTRVHEVDAPRGAGDDRLTDAQLTALRLAFDRGYFDEPRESSLEDLAAELEITRQAFSGRLRRGLDTILEERLRRTDRD